MQRTYLAWIAATLGSLAMAQDEIRSGPPAGRQLTELKVFDSSRGETAVRDLAPELQRGPVAILFVHELTRNVAPVIRMFGEHCGDRAVLGLRSHLILLSGDRTESERRLPVVSKALHLPRPMLLSTDGQEGPGNYALHRKAALTLVLARDGVVRDSIALVDTGAHDEFTIAMGLEAITGSAPADDTALAAKLLQGPMDRERLIAALLEVDHLRRAALRRAEAAEQQLAAQRGGMREGMRDVRGGEDTARAERMTPAAETAPLPPAPRNEVAATVLRRLVRKDLDAVGIDECLASLRELCANDAMTKREVTDWLRAMLAGQRYGNDASREKIRVWLQQQ